MAGLDIDDVYIVAFAPFCRRHNVTVSPVESVPYVSDVTFPASTDPAEMTRTDIIVKKSFFINLFLKV